MSSPRPATTIAPGGDGRPVDARNWWRSAVIYQVYIRSFADSDGDGLGDIAGLRARLPYLADLGVDALWINPWYPSPMADAGYDVSDYRAVEPRFGSIADADLLLHDAHELGMRVLLDIVPNHTSDQHRWFVEALAAGPGSPARERYLFRPGRGVDGAEPPNDWRAVFGGPAWERVTEADGTPGEWYLHLFAPQQPDLNWGNREVREEFLDVLGFWFDRGVDGFRIDVAHSLLKDYALPDLGDTVWPRPAGAEDSPHPFWDRDEVHEVYREWRALADTYDPPRVFVAEAWVHSFRRLIRYVRPDELHTAFNFDFLGAPWDAERLRVAINDTLSAHARVGAPPTWVLANHDVARTVSRYARPQDRPTGPIPHLKEFLGRPADFELGERRARAAALLMLALPGGAYVYQGEELGLPEVEDLPADVLADPTWERSGHTDPGRDGCRVPLPWSGTQPPYGFGPPGSTPWLPQPPLWARLSAEAEGTDPASMLTLYRQALRLRRSLPALGDGTFDWLPSSDAAVLAFQREPGFACVTNIGERPVALPAGSLLLTSTPLTPDGMLPTDATAWLAT